MSNPSSQSSPAIQPKPPIVRRHLQTIRKLWQNSSPQQPFLFTHRLDTALTVEDFCVQFVTQKYMQ